MPQMATRTVLAASGTASCFQNEQFEQAPFRCIADVALATDATGVLAAIFSGSDLEQAESPVPIKTINVPPVLPDDFYIQLVLMQGEKLRVNVRDTSGAQRIVMAVAKLTPF